MDIRAVISKAAITFQRALHPLAAPVGTKDRFLKTRVWQDLLWVLREKKRKGLEAGRIYTGMSLELFWICLGINESLVL